MTDDEINAFLKAAGVDEILAILTTAGGKTMVVNTTRTPTTEAGFMYQLKKMVDAKLIVDLWPRSRKTDGGADKKL